MRKHVPYVTWVSLLGLLTVVPSATLMGCNAPFFQDADVGTDEDTTIGGSEAGGDGGPTDDETGIGGDGVAEDGAAPGENGAVDAEDVPPSDVDPDEGATIGDAICLAVVSAESVTAVQCSTGPCGQVGWQNDCGESAVVIMLDDGRERILQILGITPRGIGTAFVDPEDWSDNMAYGIVVGIDAIECGSQADCSVSDLVQRELLDLEQLVVIAVN